ncbi:dihydrofolate reductase family protein [Candidatus Chloroploca sp. Khr17]|uniref:RibD family protein n=1 Tax=Candidatus Chloroploca sp. Khr17 TaxID=2496869 RepID=UPI00101D69C5|nr:dihydrofolate reductase family protein [Candidatus Chloroploca sp. Khr17]
MIVPYTLLFDEDRGSGPGLPLLFQALYGSDWRMPPPPAERPYTFTNFVVSQDGRISFDEPHRSGGGEVSRHAPHDVWLMALIRARADAILTGGGTLRAAGRHRWTPWETFPAAEVELAALRAAEGRQPLPLLVVISGRGDLPATAPALHVPGQPLLIATTAAGAERVRAALPDHPNLTIVVAPGERVDLAPLLRSLRVDHGITTLLSEGGARVYGELLRDRLIDEVFTTLSPIIVGNRVPPAPPRTSLVEGTAFSPDDPPRLHLVSLRRFEDYLFQRAMVLDAKARSSV